MTEPTKAVFLSYAAQDTEAAARICTALEGAGIEVWFDQSELRGRDVSHLMAGDVPFLVPVGRMSPHCLPWHLDRRIRW